jgi:ectoine hydroxylase-related dioxygenase (phytanoyl-CoA dioxygenase family)
VQAIKDIDRITFENPISQIIKLPTNDHNPYNSDSWWLGVETGQLLLFPSSLLHAVEEVTTETTRISISFNTFFKGHIGEESNLTLLNIEA